MRDLPPSLPRRIYRKLRAIVMRFRVNEYLSRMDPSSPLKGIPVKVVGDASADPTEFFDHYDAFANWAAKKIFAKGARQSILDVGSVKMMSAVLSVAHDVTALVLCDCEDQISDVQYVIHDVSDRLPFPDQSFDVFTSMASLPLIGLGRYGDKLNPNCLVDLVLELSRVMKPDADLLVSFCLGKNVLNFNNGWFLDSRTIQVLFNGWLLVDYLVDNQSSPRGRTVPSKNRFSKDISVEDSALGDYRVAFFHFRQRTSIGDQ